MDPGMILHKFLEEESRYNGAAAHGASLGAVLDVCHLRFDHRKSSLSSGSRQIFSQARSEASSTSA